MWVVTRLRLNSRRLVKVAYGWDSRKTYEAAEGPRAEPINHHFFSFKKIEYQSLAIIRNYDLSTKLKELQEDGRPKALGGKPQHSLVLPKGLAGRSSRTIPGPELRGRSKAALDNLISPQSEQVSSRPTRKKSSQWGGAGKRGNTDSPITRF